jgi:hypothetical protein
MIAKIAPTNPTARYCLLIAKLPMKAIEAVMKASPKTRTLISPIV